MRTLALKFNTKIFKQEASCAEIFLPFSPRVQFRDPGLIFIDIESTSGLLGGDSSALKKALELAHRMSFEDSESAVIHAAIADHPYTAQAMASTPGFQNCISTAGDDQKTLSRLPLESLMHLEGLTPWPQTSRSQHIINFFHSLGFQHLDQMLHFDLPSFRERWGELGISLWKRLHLREEQPISPLTTVDPLTSYGHFDDPVSLTEVLMQKLEPCLEVLFLRLQGLRRFATHIEIILHCEYSKQQHVMKIEPVSPSRNLGLFLDLLENKLEKMDLQNPVSEFEILLVDAPEKIQQLELFGAGEKSAGDNDSSWQRLISFAKQSEVEMGFLQPEASHFPEKSYRLISDWPKHFSPEDSIIRLDESIQVKSVYAKGLAKSPRPSLILQEPLALSQEFIDRLTFFSHLPSERIESSWWESFVRSPRENHRARDYYFAAAADGQLLWIYRDLDKNEYFLHGYFD